jgi:hypothetical protein
MNVLIVTGGDFSAMHVDDRIGVKEAYKLAKENGGNYVIDDDYVYAELSIREFGEVDPEFISFICDNFIDYDQSKDTDFFIIDDEVSE